MNQGPSKFQLVKLEREQNDFLFFFFPFSPEWLLNTFQALTLKKEKKKKVTHILVLSQPLYKYIDYSSVTYVPNKSTY